MFIHTLLEILTCLCVAAALLQDILLIFMFTPYRGKASAGSLPGISILLAMRDEEDNVDRCLNAVREMDYPPSHMEILVGDDNSSDNTWEKISAHAAEDKRIRTFRITSEVGVARGKANVLAQLIPHATTDLFLITDADVAVVPSWAKAMTENLPEGTGLVNGLTAVEENTFQHMEWLQAQGMMHVLQQFVPVTAIGNNMMVTREAYESTGGFEYIPLPVTEDFALTRAVVRKGYRLQSRLSARVLGKTHSLKSLKELVSQRKRWMQGAMRLPAGILFLLFVRALYYPAVLGMFAMFPVPALIIVLLKMLLQGVFIYRVNRQAHQKIAWYAYVLFDFYQFAMIWLEVFAYLFPGKTRWKGRSF